MIDFTKHQSCPRINPLVLNVPNEVDRNCFLRGGALALSVYHYGKVRKNQMESKVKNDKPHAYRKETIIRPTNISRLGFQTQAEVRI